MVRRSARVRVLASARQGNHASGGSSSPSTLASPAGLVQEDEREGPQPSATSAAQAAARPNRRKRRISRTLGENEEASAPTIVQRPRIKRESSAPTQELAAHLHIGDSGQAFVGDYVAKVSAAQVLRYTYQEHALLDRTKALPKKAWLLHATSATTPLLSLLARLEDFHSAEDFQKLCGDGLDLSLQRCMRGTLHYIMREHLATVMRVYGLDPGESDKCERWAKHYGVRIKDLQPWEEPVCEVLREKGPMTAVGIKSALGPGFSARYKGGHGEGSLVAVVAKWLWYTGTLEYGLWNDTGAGQRCYRLSEHPISKGEVLGDDGSGVVALAIWYFGMYGPASMNDFVWWSGLGVKLIREVFPQVIAEADLVPVEVQDDPRYPVMYIPRDQAAGLLSTPSVPCPEMARILPYEDAIVKAYKETRFRFFGPASRTYEMFYCAQTEKLAMSRMGELNPCVWVDGRPVGNWKHSKGQAGPKAKTAGVLEIKLFPESVSGMSAAEVRRKLAKELERFSAFAGVESVVGL